MVDTVGGRPLSHELLRDARLYAHLLRIDQDLADKTRAARCPRCSGRLDRGDYPRKPRGGPATLGLEHGRRLSLCCAACRRRVTPPSARFFGRRVYLAPAFLVISAMTRKLTGGRLRRIGIEFGVDRRTVIRWRQWWREIFPTTSFWRGAKARFMPPVAADELPASLIERFSKGDELRPLGLVLTFLSPLTARFSMAR